MSRLIAVVGPTASGKSALGLRLARECGGEIVSCDSLQVYRGLDIGSAKPTREEQLQVPHHLVDVVEPDQSFSAADYSRLARRALVEIAGRGRTPFVVGGTGLYLRALLDGLFEGPSRNPALRARLERLAQRFGDARLHRLLARVDPAAAGRIQPRDRIRVVRALEVYRDSGRRLSDQQLGPADPLAGFEVRILGLDPERESLRRAVEQRARAMLDRGLLDEVRSLLARGYAAELRPLRAIGYRQALAVVRGEAPLAAVQDEIATATMRYAKRQMTWFRHQARVDWFREPEPALEAAREWLAIAPSC